MIWENGNDGQARYYLTDQVDSVKVVLDDSGEAVTRFEYLPYGEAWFTEKTAGVEEDHSPRFDQQDVGSVRRGRRPEGGRTHRSWIGSRDFTFSMPGIMMRWLVGLFLLIL